MRERGRERGLGVGGLWSPSAASSQVIPLSSFYQEQSTSPDYSHLGPSVLLPSALIIHPLCDRRHWWCTGSLMQSMICAVWGSPVLLLFLISSFQTISSSQLDFSSALSIASPVFTPSGCSQRTRWGWGRTTGGDGGVRVSAHGGGGWTFPVKYCSV